MTLFSQTWPLSQSYKKLIHTSSWNISASKPYLFSLVQHVMFIFSHRYSLDFRGFQLNCRGEVQQLDGRYLFGSILLQTWTVWPFGTSGWICKGDECPQVYLNTVHISSVKFKQLVDIWPLRSCKKLAGTICAYSYKEKAQEHNYYLIMTVKKLKLNFNLHLAELYFAKLILLRA